MELTTTSILTLVIGLIIGGAIVFVIYYIINKKRTNKAIKLIDEAKKEADKQKRDALLELKEEYGNIYNLNLTMGAGKTNISALFKGSNKITTGVGEFNINLFNSLNDYKVKINKGIGNIKVNGEEINSNYENGKGLVSLTIEGGVGNINLTSNENNA